MNIVRASVAIPRPVRRLFTYTVPPSLLSRCRRGVRVVVPFGRRKLTGYLIEVGQGAGESRASLPLKAVEEVLDPDPVLTESILDLTRWSAEYYLVSWGEMLRAALPGMKAVLHRMVAITDTGQRLLRDAPLSKVAADPVAREVLGLAARFSSERGKAIRLSVLRKRLGPRFRASLLSRLERDGLVQVTEIAAAPGPRARSNEYAILAGRDDTAVSREGAAKSPRLGARQRDALKALQEGGGKLAVPRLLERASADRSTLRSLVKRGLVWIEAVEAPRQPHFMDLPADPAPPLRPTPDQQAAIAAIETLLHAGQYATCLLQGVTGSGKTEVYLKAIEAVVASGRKALYLVPEIGLTPILARRMRARFGEVLAVLHSRLSEGERHGEWRRIRDGKVEVVLGARSAVFAPVAGLGLIVVDEEHDASYKQEEYPRYNGRDLAIVRGKMAGAVVVLGSATPSMESYDRAMRGKYVLLGLPSRVGTAGLPLVERVDMRREFKEVGREPIVSRRLLAALQDRIGRREQSLVLLNRRGFSTFVLCRACGEQVGCRRCSIAMTLHLRDRRLRCHYCGESRGVPETCPACGGSHLHFGGTGTERLEQVLTAALPGARIERMDRDTVRGRGSVEGILSRVERGQIDILLGTQMIAKGHDFPNVTLVGVLAGDALLGLPDFRAAERTFQLLAQVAGRSGRGDLRGEVIVQAYDADHHAIRSACEHDLQGFAAKELAYRKALNYPPYSALAVILVKDRVFDRARAGAATVAALLRRRSPRSDQVLGPAPAPLERLRGEYRVQVLLKAASRRQRQAALGAMLEELDRGKTRVDRLVIDVDPMSTL